MSQQLIEAVEQKHLKQDVPHFEIGNTVDVHTIIREGGKERVQIFNGVVIARRGRGMNANFTVRRIVNNEGVERTFVLHSPLTSDIKVRRRGKVRRAKLYFLRGRVGKARRLREVRTSKARSEKPAAAPQPAAAESPAPEAAETTA